jgi:hypothetical protein
VRKVMEMVRMGKEDRIRVLRRMWEQADETWSVYHEL